MSASYISTSPSDDLPLAIIYKKKRSSYPNIKNIESINSIKKDQNSKKLQIETLKLSNKSNNNKLKAKNINSFQSSKIQCDKKVAKSIDGVNLNSNYINPDTSKEKLFTIDNSHKDNDVKFKQKNKFNNNLPLNVRSSPRIFKKLIEKKLEFESRDLTKIINFKKNFEKDVIHKNDIEIKIESSEIDVQEKNYNKDFLLPLAGVRNESLNGKLEILLEDLQYKNILSSENQINEFNENVSSVTKNVLNQIDNINVDLRNQNSNIDKISKQMYNQSSFDETLAGSLPNFNSNLTSPENMNKKLPFVQLSNISSEKKYKFFFDKTESKNNSARKKLILSSMSMNLNENSFNSDVLCDKDKNNLLNNGIIIHDDLQILDNNLTNIIDKSSLARPPIYTNQIHSELILNEKFNDYIDLQTSTLLNSQEPLSAFQNQSKNNENNIFIDKDISIKDVDLVKNGNDNVDSNIDIIRDRKIRRCRSAPIKCNDCCEVKKISIPLMKDNKKIKSFRNNSGLYLTCKNNNQRDIVPKRRGRPKINIEKFTISEQANKSINLKKIKHDKRKKIYMNRRNINKNINLNCDHNSNIVSDNISIENNKLNQFCEDLSNYNSITINSENIRNSEIRNEENEDVDKIKLNKFTTLINENNFFNDKNNLNNKFSIYDNAKDNDSSSKLICKSYLNNIINKIDFSEQKSNLLDLNKLGENNTNQDPKINNLEVFVDKQLNEQSSISPIINNTYNISIIDDISNCKDIGLKILSTYNSLEEIGNRPLKFDEQANGVSVNIIDDIMLNNTSSVESIPIFLTLDTKDSIITNIDEKSVSNANIKQNNNSYHSILENDAHELGTNNRVNQIFDKTVNNSPNISYADNINKIISDNDISNNGKIKFNVDLVKNDRKSVSDEHANSVLSPPNKNGQSIEHITTPPMGKLSRGQQIFNRWARSNKLDTLEESLSPNVLTTPTLNNSVNMLTPSGILKKRVLFDEGDVSSPPSKQRRVCFSEKIDTLEIPNCLVKIPPPSKIPFINDENCLQLKISKVNDKNILKQECDSDKNCLNCESNYLRGQTEIICENNNILDNCEDKFALIKINRKTSNHIYSLLNNNYTKHSPSKTVQISNPTNPHRTIENVKNNISEIDASFSNANNKIENFINNNDTVLNNNNNNNLEHFFVNENKICHFISNQNVEEVACIDLIYCEASIEEILPRLTATPWLRGLKQYFVSRGICTIGQLSKLRSDEVDFLPIAKPKFLTLRSTLLQYFNLKKVKLGLTEEANQNVKIFKTHSKMDDIILNNINIPDVNVNGLMISSTNVVDHDEVLNSKHLSLENVLSNRKDLSNDLKLNKEGVVRKDSTNQDIAKKDPAILEINPYEISKTLNSFMGDPELKTISESNNDSLTFECNAKESGIDIIGDIISRQEGNSLMNDSDESYLATMDMNVQENQYHEQSSSATICIELNKIEGISKLPVSHIDQVENCFIANVENLTKDNPSKVIEFDCLIHNMTNDAETESEKLLASADVSLNKSVAHCHPTIANKENLYSDVTCKKETFCLSSESMVTDSDKTSIDLLINKSSNEVKDNIIIDTTIDDEESINVVSVCKEMSAAFLKSNSLRNDFQFSCNSSVSDKEVLPITSDLVLNKEAFNVVDTIVNEVNYITKATKINEVPLNILAKEVSSISINTVINEDVSVRHELSEYMDEVVNEEVSLSSSDNEDGDISQLKHLIERIGADCTNYSVSKIIIINKYAAELQDKLFNVLAFRNI